MKRICVDSTVLICAHRAASGSDAESDRRCLAFLSSMEMDGTEVLVPAACVSEILVRIPEEDHSRVIEGLGRAYRVVPFDLSAAVRTGVLHRARLRDHAIEELKAEPGRTTKAKIKFDLMILGTAMARRADCLYAEDDDFPRLARGEIPCSRVPAIPRQEALRGDDGRALVMPLRSIKGGRARR